MAKNDQYWKTREEQWIKQNITNDRQLSKQLRSHYRDLSKALSTDINQFYINYAGRENLSMAEAVKKVKAFDVKDFEATAAKMVAEKDFSDKANERLRIYNATMRINRLQMLKSQLGLELINSYSRIAGTVLSWLTKRYRAELKRQAGILGRHKDDNPKTTLSNVINASFHGATWSQRLWVSQDELKARLDAVVSRAMIQGLNPKTIATELLPLVNREVDGRRQVAERLAITETARVQDQAQMDSFKQYGIDYCRWVAEPTACEDCLDIAAENDGIYPISKVPSIPVHARCRCSKAGYIPEAINSGVQSVSVCCGH